jgi:hypothetical protein
MSTDLEATGSKENSELLVSWLLDQKQTGKTNTVQYE